MGKFNTRISEKNQVVERINVFLEGGEIFRENFSKNEITVYIIIHRYVVYILFSLASQLNHKFGDKVFKTQVFYRVEDLNFKIILAVYRPM